MNIDGHVVVVNGATGGIGAAAATLFAAAGAQVVVGYNSSEQKAAVVRDSLPGTGHICVRIPLEDPVAIVAAAGKVAETFGRADVLINSAGFTQPIPHHDLRALDDALFERILVANARGPYSTIRAFESLLRSADAPIIINVSSISAFTASGSNVAYCAAKAALDTMTFALARALGPKIRALCVSPAAVATDFVAGRTRDKLEQLAKATPLGRIVEADDVARAIIACVTHLTTATGTAIVVDGGRRLV